jgi:hypothetical protein
MERSILRTLPPTSGISPLSHWVDGLVESVQCDCVDEEQAISVPPGVPLLYLDRHSRAALLGGGNLRQLCVLPERQSRLPDHPAHGATFSVYYFGYCEMLLV